MTPHLSKTEQRKERKKKKVAAYLEIVKLNKTGLKSGRTSSQGIRNKHKPSHSCEKEDESVAQVGSDNALLKGNHDDSPAVLSLCEHPDQASTRQLELVSFQRNYSMNSPCKTMERKHCDKYLPKLKLKMCGTSASLTYTGKNRIPLVVPDIHNFLMFAILGQKPYLRPSRWCNLEKRDRLSHVVVLIIENLSLSDFTNHCSKFQHMTLEHQLELVSPLCYNGNLVYELLGVSEQTKEESIQKSRSLEETDVGTNLAISFGVSPQQNHEATILPKNDAFSRTLLLLSVQQLEENDYPLPNNLPKESEALYKFTKDSYKAVTSSSPMYALDCEMSQTTSGLEVTRICVVDECLKVIYKTFVKPYNVITNYLTQFSGVTKKHLADVNVRLEDVQSFIQNNLPNDAILVGQSLNFDLHALKVMHPFIIDTSVIYNISGNKRHKSKLALLSQKFLKEEIQKNHGHDPEEDSISALKLVQLKLKKGLEFGDVLLTGRQDEKSEGCAEFKKKSFSRSLTYLIESKKTVAVFADRNIMEEYKQCFSKASSENDYGNIKCHIENSNESVVNQTCECAVENYLSLAHIRYPATRDDETCMQVDKYCSDLWGRVSLNGMFLVVLGGTESCNGLALMQIKR